MKFYAELYKALKRNNRESDILELLIDYFSKVCERDKIWTLYILSGGKVKKKFRSQQLKEWACEYAGIPDWLFEESYRFTGDLIETVSLILPGKETDSNRTLSGWMDFVNTINLTDESEMKEKIIEAWKCLVHSEKYVFNKLITGSFKSGVNEKALIKALSEFLSIENNVIARRLKSEWHPDKISFKELFGGDDPNDVISKPYPFITEEVLETDPDELGSAGDWLAEWKFTGIRVKIIYRQEIMFIWTEDEDLVTDKFPEIEKLKYILPEGTVLEGVLLCFGNGKPLPLTYLKSRAGRKNISRKILQEYPVMFIVYDILEYNGNDIRHKTLTDRKEIISNFKLQISNIDLIKFSQEINFENWEELRKMREKSVEIKAEGILLRKKNSVRLPDGKDKCLIWKPVPLTIDAVLIYAMKGERTDLFTEYTFGVWDEGKLVSIAKINSGLSEEDIREVSEFVKNNTLEKFGPVRTVKPELVFEISFENISESKRHKSGVVLHLPGIIRWKKDKRIEEVIILENLKKLII